MAKANKAWVKIGVQLDRILLLHHQEFLAG